jgi:hypothetical protein
MANEPKKSDFSGNSGPGFVVDRRVWGLLVGPPKKGNLLEDRESRGEVQKSPGSKAAGDLETGIVKKIKGIKFCGRLGSGH